LTWQNHVFGDSVKVIGVIGDRRIMQIVTCQPWIPPCIPATDAEIIDYLESLHFQRFEINPDVPMFFNEDLEIVLADVHVGNILRTEEKLVPIDVVMGIPGPELRKKIRQLIGV
jgi:hypothetical protein